MEISAIMNIYELAANRKVKQRADNPAKKSHEMIRGNPPPPLQVTPKGNIVSEDVPRQNANHSEVEVLTRAGLNRNKINIHT